MAESAGSVSVEAETLTHVLGLIEAFHAFDSDNDGSINAPELGGIMGSLGYNVSEQDVQAMMQREDGQLSLADFLDMNTGDLEVKGMSELKTALEELDLEEHDVLSGEELYEVIENVGVKLTLSDCQEIVACMDGDGDGAITVQEFKLLVNSLI